MELAIFRITTEQQDFGLFTEEALVWWFKTHDFKKVKITKLPVVLTCQEREGNEAFSVGKIYFLNNRYYTGYCTEAKMIEDLESFIAKGSGDFEIANVDNIKYTFGDK